MVKNVRAFNPNKNIFFTVFIGLLIGFTYDIFRLLRKTFKHPDYLTQIEDFIYWLLSTFIMFYLILIKNDGELRLFTIIGVFIGVIIYPPPPSFLILKVGLVIINFIKKIIITILKIIYTPIKLILKILKVPLSLLTKFIYKLILPLRKYIIKLKVNLRFKLSKASKEIKTIIKKI